MSDVTREPHEISPEMFSEIIQPAMEKICADVNTLYENAEIPIGVDRPRIALPAIFDQWYALVRQAKEGSTHADVCMMVSGFLIVAGERFDLIRVQRGKES
jgi:hypothetical protein